ncbi:MULTISPECIES: hypothetical protein [unclassified Novosphingobium]|uniref:hypothetical protein n=1 Tax=unclassified Novosphingobium TaxID=2644732 RepID=UPI00086D9C7B|nr:MULTISPECIES: hypothetical protein [unclassified Novosphingobium]MBN9145183.1 hypothetical protein [Novosphingobium sp.]MDR6709559.1 hypothetical protein [Novosphingobium sp. 1748]ODU78241.1 MAG: hypothetical protein ABT10_23105 [Novosphingobium sp. SCN 63-17]OJX88641.1 MAG: hypothetical protein BGP00_00965 [Novosphingobium sp. 63-713]
MPRGKKAKPEPNEPRNDAMSVAKQKDEKDSIAIAKTMLGLRDYADAFRDVGDKAAEGDLEMASRMLTSQALTLDSIFAETARRMAQNMGEHLPVMEIYARIAMKAQTNSRATLEALAKLHQPREQTVRHVHVNEGGQAVIADHFHRHAGQPTGEAENGPSSEQPHAPDRTSGGAAGQGAALPSPDAGGNGLPIASGEARATVPDARRGQE